MEKYFVTVNQGNGVRFYKDEACKIPHREDGPAVECANGNKQYWQNGKLHRDDGPAVEDASGGKWYYQNDKLHRDDGPAVLYSNGDKEYCQNGKLHRDDGPAVEFASGDKCYYLNGKELSKSEFLARNVTSCEGKMVEIDGKKYRLTAI